MIYCISTPLPIYKQYNIHTIFLYIFFQKKCYACMPFAKRDYSESETSDDGSTDDDE